MQILTVTQAFGDYAVGEQITDPTEIDDLVASHAGAVVRSVVDDPAPAPKPPAPPKPDTADT